MKAITFSSERLTYKPLGSSFASASYLSWLNDIEVKKHLHFGETYTMDRLKEYLVEVEEKEILFWAICIRESDKHIGNIKVDPIDLETKSGEYGIMLGDRSEWNKGYAFEASRAVIDYCFGPEVDLKQITLGVFEENWAAVRLYEKLGFMTYQNRTGHNFFHGEERDSLRMILKAASK